MPKNPNGSGSISKYMKTQNGKLVQVGWRAQYSAGFDPKTGKLIRKSIYGKTQDEVRKKLTAVLKSIDDKTYVEPSKMLVSEWLDEWLPKYNANINESTMTSYKTQVEYHIKPQLGSVKLGKLTTAIVQTAYNNLLKGGDKAGGHAPISPKTLKNIHGTLHKAMEMARRLGYIAKNPTEFVVLPKVLKKDAEFIEPAKLSQLFLELKNDLFCDVIIVAAALGLRFAEVTGITWDSVNFERSELLINKQLIKPKTTEQSKIHGGYYFGPPKYNEVRTLIMPQIIADIFHKWQECEPESNPKNLVFTDENGVNLKQDTIRKHYKKACKKVGIPEEIRIHDLRKTFTVMSLQNGDSPETVKRNLGHRTANFTLEVYANVSKQMQRESAQNMNVLMTHILESET